MGIESTPNPSSDKSGYEKMSGGEKKEHNEAHEMANMQRAASRPNERRESGAIGPSVEEYDRALEEIEELQRLAEEEPTATKIAYKMGRVMHMMGRIPAVAIAFPALYTETVAKMNETGAVLESGEALKRADRSVSEFLTDAQKALQDAKEAGEEFAEKEVEGS